MSYTYTAHITFGADNDEQAARFNECRDMLARWLIANEYPLTPNNYLIDSVHITDADDWSEHIDIEPLTCDKNVQVSVYRTVRCLRPLNRHRSGVGYRTCPDHPPRGAKMYPIEDVCI